MEDSKSELLDTLDGKKRGFDYKWVVIVCCFMMEMVTLGFCSSPKSYFIGPVTNYLGISRGAYAINDTLRYLSSAVISIFFGALIGKFGPRKLIGAGFFSLIASTLSYALAESIWLIYLGGILLGVGLSLTTTAMVGYVINKWSPKNKGTIMGAVLAANGLGGAIAMQMVSPIIERQSEIPGYKLAYLAIAAILTFFGTLVLIFFRSTPKNGAATTTVAKKKRRSEAWVGIGYPQAKRQTYFYVFFICIFFTGFCITAINGVAVQHMKDVGLDPVFVTNIWSIHSLVLAGFKFLTGFLYDKLGLRKTILICSADAVIVMVSLASVTPTLEGKILAVVYSVFSGLALPLETIMLPILTGDLFGQKSFEKILGLTISINTLGYALASPLMNLVYDKLGSYQAGLFAGAALMAAVIVVMQIVITIAYRMKKQILAEENQQEKNAIA